MPVKKTSATRIRKKTAQIVEVVPDAPNRAVAKQKARNVLSTLDVMNMMLADAGFTKEMLSDAVKVTKDQMKAENSKFLFDPDGNVIERKVPDNNARLRAAKMVTEMCGVDKPPKKETDDKVPILVIAKEI